MSWTCPICKGNNHDDMRTCACGYDSDNRVEEPAAPVIVKRKAQRSGQKKKPLASATATQADPPAARNQINAWTWLKQNGTLVGWGAAAAITLLLLLASGFKAMPFMLFVATAVMLPLYFLPKNRVGATIITTALVTLGLLLSWKYVADVFYYKPGRIMPQYFTSAIAPSGIGTRQTGYEFEIGISSQGFGGFINRSIARLTHDHIYRLFDDNAIDELKKYPDDPRVKEYFLRLDERNGPDKPGRDGLISSEERAAKRQELVQQIEQYKKAKKWPGLIQALEKELVKMDTATDNVRGENDRVPVE